MARTTAAQFAGQLRRLGTEVTMVAGHAIANYRGVEVTVRFHRDFDAFDVAWRTDVPAEAGTAIGSMAGVRRALGLPTMPRHLASALTRPRPRGPTAGAGRQPTHAAPNRSTGGNLVSDPQQSDPTSTDTNADRRGLLNGSDIQALRRADSVCLHTLPDGSAHIYALLTTWAHPQPRIFTAVEQRLFPDPDHTDRRRRIPVTATVVGFDHDGRWHEHRLPGATGFAMIHVARLDDVWRTIVALLRAGDVLTLQWRASNNDQYLRDAGLHRDELRLAIRRGQRHWTFLVDIGTSPDNTARMIRGDTPT